MKFLQDLIKRKEKELTDLKTRSDESNDLNEVRSIGSQIDAIRSEIASAKAELARLDGEEKSRANNFKPGQAIFSTEMNERSADINTKDVRSTVEYRTAFMNYIQRGVINKEVLQFETRADQTSTSEALGVLIPTTIVQQIITGVEKVYGQLYSRVNKTNLKGGVKYPIGSFKATFKRVTESTVSDKQKVDGVTGSVDFTYKIGEIKLARTLLEMVLSVEVFEEKFAEVIIKAYVEAMDKEIMLGADANNQCDGIITEAKKTSSRIPAKNIIEFTAEEMADWTKWQEKLFAKIPIAMRSLKPEFVMTANTYEANIKTLKDENNRPVFTETFNPVDGEEICKFKGKDVVLVEEDILSNFNDAKNGDYFGMYWVPEESYAINSNLEFIVFDYFDQDTNQQIKKALVINDGKILDPTRIYLLKKKITG